MTATIAHHLFLASQSPRRRELLARLGLSFEVIDATVEERRLPGETATGYVQRVARDKAGAGWLQVAAVQGAVVLAADTEVILDDDVFGKPSDRADAERMLRRLGGRTHEVITAIAVVSAGRDMEILNRSTVTFVGWTEPGLNAYLDTDEWRGKAGAYAIQGRAEAFISRIEGSYSSVMGLPVHDTATVLRAFGLDC